MLDQIKPKGQADKPTYEFALSHGTMQANNFMIDAFISKAVVLLNACLDISPSDVNALDALKKSTRALVAEIEPFIKKNELPTVSGAPGKPKPPADGGKIPVIGQTAASRPETKNTIVMGTCASAFRKYWRFGGSIDFQ